MSRQGEDRSPTLPSLEGAVKSVLNAVTGFGPLQQYCDYPEVEEIWMDLGASNWGVVAGGGRPGEWPSHA